VNLVSRPPGDERDLVVNQTSQSGTDALAYVSDRLSDHWGFTFLGGAHRQGEEDIAGEGWADVPGYDRAEIRPRLFWNSGTGASLFATVGALTEHRIGGSMPGVILGDSEPYTTAVNTNRVDGGAVGVFPIHRDTLTIRASGTKQWERDDFGPTSYFSTQHGDHATAFTEATLTVPLGRATGLIGTGYEQDAFSSPEVSGFDYSYSTPAVFAQVTWPIGRRVAITASGRCDFQNQFGTYCNPRVSALWRAPGGFDARLSGATGFAAPTPFIDETQGIPFARLEPFNTTSIPTCAPSVCVGSSGTGAYATTPFSLEAEQARYGSFDLTKHVGPTNVTGTVFAWTIEHPLILVPQASILIDRPQLVNASGPTQTIGGEFFAVYGDEPFVVLLEYAYIHSTEISPLTGARIDAPLVPQNSGGVDVAWESDERGTRVALDVFYTGAQPVLEDPYRTMTVAYATVDLLIAQHLGSEVLYISGENLGNVMQTHWDPLVLPGPGDEYRWTTDIWGPLAGRVINAGVRMSF
jgi:outer membrane receptor for ferrienterochelin and colicins